MLSSMLLALLIAIEISSASVYISLSYKAYFL